MPSPKPTLSVSNLSKKFDSGFSLGPLKLEISPKQIFALIGPNGSGKTTFIKLLLGLLNSDSGSIRVNGIDLANDPTGLKSQIGYVPDNPTGYDYLSGREFLSMTSDLRQIPSTDKKDLINSLIDIFHLQDLVDRPMEDYSRGTRQKIAILSSLISDPKLLIIDEPIVGLDPQSISILGQLLKQYAQKGGCVLLSTHILDFGQEYSTHVGIMYQGQIVKTGSSKKLGLEKLYQSIVEQS